MVPDYCQNLLFRDSDNYDALDPVPMNFGIDIEVDWNLSVSLDQGKIKNTNVVDLPTTTDLLCSPGKYLDYEYKIDSLYTVIGNAWGPTVDETDYNMSNLPKEVVGFALNGTLLAQTLTADGYD